MPHLWVRDETQWGIYSLGGTCELRDVSPAFAEAGAALRPAAGQWILLARDGRAVSVNGGAVIGGMRVLTDRDEIRFRGERAYFSAECLSQVEEFGGAANPVYCPRCKLPVERGPVVRCGGCGSLHHHGEVSCWTYAETCALCPQPSAFDAGFRWTPEGL